MSSLFSWGFNGTVRNIHGDNTVKLQNSNGEWESFANFVESKVPTFRNKNRFRLKPYLVNGALQNYYLLSLNQQIRYRVWYGRELWTYKQSEKYPHLHDGDFTVDYVTKLDATQEEFDANYAKTLPENYPKQHPRTRFMTSEESENLHESWRANKKPIVVIIHGLLGGSNEYHIRGAAEKLTEQGLNVLVLNSRGCCRSVVTTPHIFTALATDDIRFFIDKIAEDHPDNPLHCLAFSYGACYLSNYLGEEGANSKLTSAMVVGCTWDLVDSSYAVHGTYTGSKLFAPGLTKHLVKFIKIHKDVLSQNKEAEIEKRLELAKTATKIYEFDNLFTAPLHGFPTAMEYYRRASPTNQIMNIQTPTFILNSLDDPVVSCRLPYMEVKANPYLFMSETDIGGHFAYVQSDNTLWFLDGVAEFFKSFEDIKDRKSDYKRMVSDYAYKIGC